MIKRICRWFIHDVCDIHTWEAFKRFCMYLFFFLFILAGIALEVCVPAVYELDWLLSLFW